MSENSDKQSPYGRGFTAACIVIGAILLCGALILITAVTSSDSSAAPDASQSRSQSPSQSPAGTSVAEPSSAAGGVTPTEGSESTEGRPQRSGGCGLPAGDQAVPAKPPSADGWEVSSRVVVPKSSTYGPAETDRDGFRHCFAHSPTGAVYAAYSAIGAMADQSRAVPTARKLMVPGPDTDALIRELEEEGASTGAAATQLAGYRVVAANRDSVTVVLAIPVQSAYMSVTLTLVWHAGDWRLQPPPPGDPVGAPFAQHRDLSDFVAWSGV